jgi:alpha-L-arabinofuranosidase
LAIAVPVFAQSSRATITIDASKIENSISPLLYGQFAEFMFEDIKGGLHAELVRDRGFDEAPNALGLPRYWERDPDDRNDDDAMSFRWDNTVFYPTHGDVNTLPTQHSLQVILKYANANRRGVRQSGIPIREGLQYPGYVWLKASDFKGKVTVALERDETDGEAYATATIENVAGDWKQYSFTLNATKTDPLAKFVLLFHGKGRLWIDQVSLLPSDANDGVRSDVEQKIAALHPAFIRWPGGNVAQDYHWKWGIGQRDQRPVWVNLSWKNEPEPSDFGTDEYIRLCRRLDAEPSITVNVAGRGATAEEAAAWVEYANGPSSSKYGAMRASNGNSEPFHVKYWEIGNEIWGDWVRGNSDAETYARNLVLYVDKMKAVDPSIKIIACGNNDMRWNRTVLKLAGNKIDYLAIHHYYGEGEMKGDRNNLRAHPLRYERFYPELSKAITELVPGHEIKLAINEWNTGLPLPDQHSMTSGIYAARLLNVFERSGDLVHMSSVSDLVNGWTGGVIQASRNASYVTATYLVNQLYASHPGAQRLSSKVEGPTFDSTLEGKAIPTIDAVASRSADGKRIFLKVVNTDPTQTIDTTIRLSGARVANSATWQLVNGEELSTANDFLHPDRVKSETRQINVGASFSVTLPQHSVSVITLEAQP